MANSISKGFDIFGMQLLIFLTNKDWKAYVMGDEPREKVIFRHKNLYNLDLKVIHLF